MEELGIIYELQDLMEAKLKRLKKAVKRDVAIDSHFKVKSIKRANTYRMIHDKVVNLVNEMEQIEI